MAVTHQATVRFLRRPGSYPHVSTVKVIETHMSWVFLAGPYALKLKKPLHNTFLDFRSIEARGHACEQELRLNRRLAPDVYIGVEMISQQADGSLQFGPGVAVVDYVIRMQRLPEDVMLGTQLVRGLIRGAAGEAILERVARCIARFHQSLPVLKSSPLAWRTSIYKTIDANQAAIESYQRFLTVSDLHLLCQQQRSFLHFHAEWIDTRIQRGCMVEGHGDLRAEHVFTQPSVGAIDCLEFSAALRQLDCADEIGFLALDCERLAGEATARILLQHYQRFMKDYPPPALLHFYQSLRAAVRARLALLRLQEQSYRPRMEWIQRADQWLRLAIKHARYMQLALPCYAS